MKTISRSFFISLAALAALILVVAGQAQWAPPPLSQNPILNRFLQSLAASTPVTVLPLTCVSGKDLFTLTSVTPTEFYFCDASGHPALVTSGAPTGPTGPAFPGTDDGTIMTIPRTLKATSFETTGSGPSRVDLREESCSTITPPDPGRQSLCIDSADHAVKQINSLGTVSLLAPWYGGTSTTSLLIGTGPKTVVTQPGFAYLQGQRLGVWEVANPANYMQGTITAISGSSITFTVDKTGGSGTYADWYLGLGNLIPVSHPIGWYFDDGGAVLTPQTKYFSYPFGCTLTRWKALLPAGTTASFDVWRTAAGGGTPTVANTLVTGTPVNASGAETTGTNISSGALPVVSPDDNIAIRLTAVSGATWASIIFRCEQ